MEPASRPELLVDPPSLPEPLRRNGSPERKPTTRRLLVAAATGLLLSRLFGLPLVPKGSFTVAGFPVPIGTLFTLGLVGIQVLRGHRVLQRLLAPPVAALFFAFGLPLILAPYPAGARYGFFLVIIGAPLVLYAWTMDGM